MTPEVHALDHLVLAVSDVERTAHWYTRVLGVTRDDFEPGAGERTRTSIRFGTQKINLRPVDADEAGWFTARAATTGSADLCFLTSIGPDAVVEHLGSLGVAIEAGPTTRRGARGMIRSVYCRDPDGNLIEIASYPDPSETPSTP